MSQGRVSARVRVSVSVSVRAKVRVIVTFTAFDQLLGRDRRLLELSSARWSPWVIA